MMPNGTADADVPSIMQSPFESIDPAQLTQATGGTVQDGSWQDPNGPLINRPTPPNSETGGQQQHWGKRH